MINRTPVFLLAIDTADRSLNRDAFNHFDDIARRHPLLKKLKFRDLKKIARKQAKILQTDNYLAICSISELLKTPEEREEALNICNEVFNNDNLTQKTRDMLRLLAIAEERIDGVEAIVPHVEGNLAVLN